MEAVLERKSVPVTHPDYRRGVRPPNAGKRYPAEVLTPDEIRQLLAVRPGKGACATRNRALIVVLWRAGLRISEALSLYPKDVNTGAGTITVLHGKGDKARTVGIDPQAAAVLEQWLAKRGKLGLGARYPIFCTVSRGKSFGRRLSAAYVRDHLKWLAERAGVEKRVHPHGLRHTHASELAFENQPLTVIKEQLGHSSLSTTERYIKRIAPAALVKAMRERPWPQELEHVTGGNGSALEARLAALAAELEQLREQAGGH